ncbi:Cilia- and flagella-associated protein [Schistosoma japonicum]|uniref:Cilia- and flagella-associated protein 52 n=3 Tax=Schistosoma japonicum TaxID=6182 RepID=A0A4Z2DT56_SCHJA|nr:Cilia- and flagella-associated protein [Schistosoma japonicum]TNN19320.1 Cilia- and flagella-associated protein [Schistosoma japonicum]
MMDEEVAFDRLKLAGVIGFNGKVQNGFLVHPDGEHVIFCLGSNVIVENIITKRQFFLQGHTNNVVCIDIDKSGSFIASGQVTYMGYKATIIVWSYENKEKYAEFVLHKVKIQALGFSANSSYLASLGGQDDGSVVIWSIPKREAICGSPAQPQSAGVTLVLACANVSEKTFITAGENTVRVWNLDLENRKIRPTDCNLGQIKRTIQSLSVSHNDEVFFAGTTTGDVLTISMKYHLLQVVAPEKNGFSMGVTTLKMLGESMLLVGAGDGVLQELCYTVRKDSKHVFPTLIKTNKMKKLLGNVTAISLRGEGHQFFVTTDKCHLYRFNYLDFNHELVNTCHNAAVNDIKFPYNCSELFATCAYQDIRVFNKTKQHEVLRINIPNMTCYCIDLLHDGTAIISGWDDGRIRAFYPETGRLMYTIQNAHKKGVTAVCTTSTCDRIISGGGEGQVRVWDIKEAQPSNNRLYRYKPKRMDKFACSQESTFFSILVATMYEHTNAVSCIQLSKDNKSCVSASADSTCIVWCLETFRRKQIIFSNTLFRCICYHPTECQVIASGTNRKIGYWEVYDGSLIRELDGSRTGSINGMDITVDGNTFVTGGNDKLVKVWKYNEGLVTHVGQGHTSSITRLRISPDQKNVITVSEDGAIYIWEMPKVIETS